MKSHFENKVVTELRSEHLKEMETLKLEKERSLHAIEEQLVV